MAVDGVELPAWILAWAGTLETFSRTGPLTISRSSEGLSSPYGLFFLFVGDDFEEPVPFSAIILPCRVLTIMRTINRQKNGEKEREGYEEVDRIGICKDKIMIKIKKYSNIWKRKQINWNLKLKMKSLKIMRQKFSGKIQINLDLETSRECCNI